jgi:glutathione peroxidase
MKGIQLIRAMFVLGATLGLGSAQAQPSQPPAPPSPASPSACPALLQHTLPRLQDEKPVSLCQFSGQVVVVVNTASQCGYTPQYKSLEALYERYRQRGLVVLGFPSNDFGGQEPGSNAAIADFCENQFAVRFPMFAKTTVKSSARSTANPLFAGLAARSGQAPKWNFHKYIVSRQGDVVLSHASDMDPLDARFTQDVERLLGAK